MALMLSKHTATVYSQSGLTYLTPKSVSIEYAENWSPSIQATVTFPSATFTEALDPRTGGRLNVRLHQAFGELVEVNALTGDFGGDVSEVTAAYSPTLIRSITNDYSRPWNLFEPAYPISYITATYLGDVSNITAVFAGSVDAISKFLHGAGTFNPQPSTVLDANLGIRAMQRDYLNGETTIRLASDEALLQDYAHTSVTPYTSASNDVRTLVSYVLGKIGATLQTGTATGTFDNVKVQWQVGQNAWDFVNPIVQKAGLVLYCDESRKWYLITAGSTAGSLALNDTDNVTTLDTSLDRSTDYFDACVIEYTWNNGTTQVKQYDVYAPVGYTKVRRISYTDLPYPGAGAAQALTERALTRGEKYNVEAISNYDARPRQTITVDVTAEPTKEAVIESISWTVPDDRMTISVRELQEII